MSTQIRLFARHRLAVDKPVHMKAGMVRPVGKGLSDRAGIAGQTAPAPAARYRIRRQMPDAGRHIIAAGLKGSDRTSAQTGFVRAGKAGGRTPLNSGELNVLINDQSPAVGMP